MTAPAKINLFLHITGRRADGMHELQTLFQLLDFGDELSFEQRQDSAINLHGDMPGADNLVMLAAHRLREIAGAAGGVDVTLRKRIPVGAGLGGGSSDAATTLLVLNRLWNLGLDLDELASIGLALGADVPLFVHGQTAWGEGVGEILTPVLTRAQQFIVLYPDCAVSTAEVFRHPDLTRSKAPITMARFFREGGVNDCEPLVRGLHPEVDAAVAWLSQYGPATMTGTGSCAFVPVSDAAVVDHSDLPESWTCFSAAGLQVSPVMNSYSLFGVSPSR